MVAKTHIDLREAGRIINILAITLHILFIFLGPFDYYPFIAINVAAHISWMYGNSKYNVRFMLVSIFYWFIPAVISIVYVITSIVYPNLYADRYLIVGAFIFLGFYLACILATDSTSRADKIDKTMNPKLSVIYTSAANESVQKNSNV